MNSVARNHPLFRVGRMTPYEPAYGPLSQWSDLVAVEDIEDSEGHSYPGAAVGRRDLLPLPDGKVAFHACAIIAELDPTGGFNPTTLGPYAYVRIQEHLQTDSGASGFSHGWYSEVLAVPSLDIIPGTPDIGDTIYHHEHNTYMEREGYAFVRLGRPKDWDYKAGHAAGGTEWQPVH